MIVIGAGGHAQEILDILIIQEVTENLYFFDNVSNQIPNQFNGFPIISTWRAVEKIFQIDNSFVIAIGGTKEKLNIIKEFEHRGGTLNSVVSSRAVISPFAKMGNGGGEVF